MYFNEISLKAFLLFAGILILGLVMIKPNISTYALFEPNHLIKIVGLILVLIAMGGLVWIFGS